jgi:DNA-binding transcriptional MocR family regulator
MWTVPKYSNPSGIVYSRATVQRLARMTTAAPDFRLFWDNAYAVHHLTPEKIEIEQIDEASTRAGHPNRAFIFGSTSKITLAGAGVGLFAGSADNVAWFLKRIGTQTIGGDKINQLRHLRFLKTTDGIHALMDRHRDILAPKFRRVVELFKEHLGPNGAATWTEPQGGYFITLEAPHGTAPALFGKNLANPMAPVFYSISTLHCLTVSLAHGGAGIGSAFGEQLARGMLTEAGFGPADVHPAPGHPFDAVYVTRTVR